MDDKEQITKLYHDMYAAMVAKDEAELARVHDDSFVLIHMTGMHQKNSKFFPEIHGNFGFGCMRLPMNGGKVDYDEFCRMADAFIDAGFKSLDLIPCTSCRYCIEENECPKGIDINDT